MEKEKFLSEINFSEADVAKIIKSKVKVSSLEEIIEFYKDGEMTIKEGKSTFFDWLYDGDNDLDNVKYTIISNEAVGMTIQEYLVHINEQIVILDDGRVVYFYE